MACRERAGCAGRIATVAAALCIALYPGTLAGSTGVGPNVPGFLDSGGGRSQGGGVTLIVGSMGGSFQTGLAAGASHDLEAGWIDSSGRDEPGITGDFNGDAAVSFADFLLFAAAYGSKSGGTGFDPRFDLDDSGEIGFADFLAFAAAYGG
jgi:hypothetical protein